MSKSVVDGDSSKKYGGSIEEITRSSRFLMILFFGLALFFGVSAIIVVIIAIAGLVSGGSLAGQSSELFISVGLGVYSAILLIAGLIFKDISKCESPFSTKQARRIRIIAWLLLAYALIESFVPNGAMVSETSADVVFVARQVTKPAASIQVGSLLAAIVFFFLSSVFKYGVKLQELSDDTV